MSQIGPMLVGEEKKGSVKDMVGELEGVTGALLKESGGAFRGAFEPFREDPAAAGVLQRKMEKVRVFGFCGV